MNSEHLARRQAELNKIKKGLKGWEHNFLKKYNQKPTIKDIQKRPNIERVYKDYNAKKKQLQLLSAECADSQSLSQPISFDSQQQQQYQDPTSQETMTFNPSTSTSSSSSTSQPLSPSQKRRRGSHASVEYIRSPSHRLSRIKYVDHVERPTTSLDFGSKLNHISLSGTPDARNNAMDEDSFWLNNSQGASLPTGSDAAGDTAAADQENGHSLFDSSSSSSINTPSPFFLADNNNNTTTSSTSSSFISRNSSIKKKKKKNAALEQKLFGHLIWKPSDTLSPALKEERDSSSQPTTPTTTTTDKNGMTLDSQTATPPFNNIDATTTTNRNADDQVPSPATALGKKVVEDLKIDGLIISEHERDPFRHYDPDLMNNLEDPDYFVMPGLFASARARSTIMAPMMEDDDGRYNRILEALRQGTLGEKRRDDDDVGDMDEDLKRFLDENTDTFADETDTAQQEEAPPVYRKKFTQRRQTKLHKFKYVETTPSAL